MTSDLIIRGHPKHTAVYACFYSLFGGRVSRIFIITASVFRPKYPMNRISCICTRSFLKNVLIRWSANETWKQAGDETPLVLFISLAMESQCEFRTVSVRCVFQLGQWCWLWFRHAFTLQISYGHQMRPRPPMNVVQGIRSVRLQDDQISQNAWW